MLPLSAALPLILIPLAVFVSTLVWMARSARPPEPTRARQDHLSRRGL